MPSPLWATEASDSVWYRPRDLPQGVRLVAQKAQQSGVVLARDQHKHPAIKITGYNGAKSPSGDWT